jgi:ABC-2 type transport system ATP-binding protein
MLELRDVSKRFHGIVAVDRVSFTARAGEITGYLGQIDHHEDDYRLA